MGDTKEKTVTGPLPPPFRMLPYFLPPEELFSAEQIKEAYIARIELLQKIAKDEMEFYTATLDILRK